MRAEKEADELLDAVEMHLSKKHGESSASEYLLDILHDADDNDDGVLEKHELKLAFELMDFPLNERQLNLVLCVLDHNTTGTIEAAEFSTILLNSMRFQHAVDEVEKKLMFCNSIFYFSF